MKVINGKLEPKKVTVDLEFRSALKRALKEWFDLKIKDLPTIIKKIGIEDENYELRLLSSLYINNYICFNVISKNRVSCITLKKGTMSSPYSELMVDDKKYYLGRKVEVEEITIPKATTMAEQIYKDFMED